MYLTGFKLQIFLIFMVSNFMITGNSAECRRRPCYGIMCAIGCITPTRMDNMEPMENCETYPVGSRIIYRCVYNHDLTEISHCRSNGEWSKLTTDCLKSPERLIAPSRTITPNEIKTEPQISRPLFTTEGTISTPAVSTADRELTSLISGSDDLNLPKSQTPTTSTNTGLTTENINAGHQLQTTKFQKFASEFNETGIGNHTREMMEVLNSEKTTSSTVIIALSTIPGVIIWIILIMVLFIMRVSKNKRTHGRNRIPTSEPTDLKNTEGRDDLVPYSMEVT